MNLLLSPLLYRDNHDPLTTSTSFTNDFIIITPAASTEITTHTYDLPSLGPLKDKYAFKYPPQLPHPYQLLQPHHDRNHWHLFDDGTIHIATNLGCTYVHLVRKYSMDNCILNLHFSCNNLYNECTDSHLCIFHLQQKLCNCCIYNLVLQRRLYRIFHVYPTVFTSFSHTRTATADVADMLGCAIRSNACTSDLLSG